MNLAKILEEAARYFPNRPALIEGDKEISYAELDRATNRVASALTALGLKPGRKVALCLPNGSRWVTAYFGALKAGCAVVTFAVAMTPDELLPLLEDTRPVLMITGDEKLAEFGEAACRKVLETIVAPSGDLSWEEFLAKAESDDFDLVERDRDDLAAVLFTGGTTGLAKGVMLTHQNLLASTHNVARQERSTEQDRALCFLPLTHVFGQVHITLSTILTGGSLVVMPGFDPDTVLDALENRGVTKFYAVPTIYVRLLSLPDIGERLGSVRYTFSAAASMALELVREWKESTGLDIHEAYGMTESASMVTYNHYHKHKVGSVGTPVGTVEVSIRDMEGQQVPMGSEGEICIQGPNIMQGYLNRPKETKEAFWGSWFRSGDIGYLDGEGYLFIVDRLKDLIITGGENVYPRELEELLLQVPEVEECAVVGLPDKEYGEKVTAVVVLKPGSDISPEELRKFMRERLTPFKVPKTFNIVQDLPKSATGKLLKRSLREQLSKQEKA